MNDNLMQLASKIKAHKQSLAALRKKQKQLKDKIRHAYRKTVIETISKRMDSSGPLNTEAFQAIKSRMTGHMAGLLDGDSPWADEEYESDIVSEIEKHLFGEGGYEKLMLELEERRPPVSCAECQHYCHTEACELMQDCSSGEEIEVVRHTHICRARGRQSIEDGGSGDVADLLQSDIGGPCKDFRRKRMRSG